MIEAVTLYTLHECLPGAEKFHNVYEPDYPFSARQFLSFWIPLLSSGNGILLVYRNLEGEVAGGIGGIITQFQTSEALNAVEMFWWVDEKSRGRAGLKLLRAFEDECEKKGCDRISMAYMESSMPDTMKCLYEKLGYSAYEHHYIKKLK